MPSMQLYEFLTILTGAIITKSEQQTFSLGGIQQAQNKAQADIRCVEACLARGKNVAIQILHIGKLGSAIRLIKLAKPTFKVKAMKHWLLILPLEEKCILPSSNRNKYSSNLCPGPPRYLAPGIRTGSSSLSSVSWRAEVLVEQSSGVASPEDSGCG